MDTAPDDALTDEAILAHVKAIRGDDGQVTKQQRRLSVRTLRKVDAERIARVLGGVIEGDLLDALLGQR